MKVKFFCPYWGSASLSYPQFFRNVKDAGYEGVEMGLPFNKAQKSDILSLLKDNGLELVAQHYETTDPNPLLHKEKYQKHLYNLAEANPLFINSQTGKGHACNANGSDNERT